MKYDIMPLGYHVTCSTDCLQTGLNNNVLVVGGSGSGKTRSVLEPRLLETTQSSLVVTVTKRRIVDLYTSLFQNRGYTVMELNFAHPDKSSVSFDPMQYLNSQQDITHLAESIVMADPRKAYSAADPYWDRAAISLLSAEIGLIKMTRFCPTMADVLEFHRNMVITELNGALVTSADKAFDDLQNRFSNCFALSCWRSFRLLPSKTAGCVFGALNTTLDALFPPELTEMMTANKSANLQKLGQKKCLLFVVTSPVNPALNNFVNLFYGQMFKSLFEYGESLPDGKLPVPIQVLCDDFATGSRILNFPEYISFFREKGISVTLLLQSETQLESMYGKQDATTIINNCDTYLYLGGMDLKTAHSISQRLNAPLEEVLYMPVGQEFVFRRGQKPVVTKRYDITQNPRYRTLPEDSSHNLNRWVG